MVVASFILILSFIGVYYWFLWGDYWIPLLSLLSAIALYSMGMSDSKTMYKSMKRVNDPVLESAIILILFNIWIFIVFPFVSNSIELTSLGSIIFGFVFPYLIVVVYFNYERSSVGLRISRSESDRFTAVICSVMIIPRLALILLNPQAISLLLSNLESLVVGMIYLGFIVGFTEEFIFRGLIQNRMAIASKSRVIGIIMTASLFAAMHVFTVMAGQTATIGNVGNSLLYALLTRLPLGIILGYVWNDSENLLGVTLIHASNNITYLLQTIIGL